jgi:hypothetical protein
MTIYGTSLTIGALFDMLYDKVDRDIPNPSYQPPHPSCDHYQSLEDMLKDVYCPRCGSKNQLITHPKTILETYYTTSCVHKMHFSDNNLPESSVNKVELIKALLTKIYNSRYLKVSGGDEIDVTATGDDRYEDSFVWFHPDYTDIGGPGCYWTFDQVLKKSSNLEKYTIYLVCFELEEEITSEQLETAARKVRLFEELGLKVKQLVIGKFDHPY